MPRLFIGEAFLLVLVIPCSLGATKSSLCPEIRAAAGCGSDRDNVPCDRMDVPEAKMCCEDSCGNGRLLGRQPQPSQCWKNAIVRVGNCKKTNETCATKTCENGEFCCLDACKNAACETPHKCPSRVTRPPYQSCGILGTGCKKQCSGLVCCLDHCGDGHCVDNVFE